MRYIVRGISFLAATAVVLVLAAWAFLSLPLFATPRKAVVEHILTNNLKRDVSVNGDVRISLGTSIDVKAEELALPSELMPDTNVLEINSLSFDLPISALMNGRLNIKDLATDGIQLNLITQEDGKTSWATNAAASDNNGAAPSGKTLAIGDIFQDRELTLTNAAVLYQNAQNGLDLDARFSELLLNRKRGNTAASAQGIGDVNGEAFEINSTFPADQPFQATAIFEDISVTLDEVSSPDGFEMAINAEVSALGQLLDILKLNRVIEGTSSVGAVFKHSDGIAKIDDLAVDVALDSGQSLILSGNLGELDSPDDVSLFTRIQLYPEDATPPVTTNRYDLKLVSVDMEMDAQPGKVAQRKMVIVTNGFTLDTAGEGPPPISFSDLSRTPDGALRVGKIDLRIGQPEKPFFVLNGSIDDALQLMGITADGVLDIPASDLIAPDVLAQPNQLGELSGQFKLRGDVQKLSLSDLDTKTQGTDLWELAVTGSVENVLKFEGLDLGVDISVPSGAALMEALSLKPVDTGEANLSIDLSSQGTDWTASTAVALSESGLEFSVDLDDATTRPALRGLLESDLIRIDELQKIISAATELQKLGAESGNASENEATDETVSDRPLRDVTINPIGRTILLSGMDMDIDIDLRKIEGADGFNSLQSEVTVKDNKLDVGPLAFEYGGGSFNVHGEMDLSDDTRAMSVKGSAGGWKLHDLLETLELKKDVSGTLYADFDIKGETESVQRFLASMNGYATISMRNGSIETQLLDLAGLGVLPWLFSKERGKVAPIDCLRAPLSVSNGTISTKQTTLETHLVQVIVYGSVNLNQKSLDLDIQPRKIGKPLARSPWPVTASGPWSSPKIKVKDGPKKLRRSDGATKMPAERKPCVPDILQLQ